MVTSMKMAVFWDAAPHSLVDTDRRFRGAVSIIRMFTLTMCSSETSVNIYKTTRCYMPEDSHLLTPKRILRFVCTLI
jgi:hypothetical protein